MCESSVYVRWHHWSLIHIGAFSIGIQTPSYIGRFCVYFGYKAVHWTVYVHIQEWDFVIFGSINGEIENWFFFKCVCNRVAGEAIIRCLCSYDVKSSLFEYPDWWLLSIGASKSTSFRIRAHMDKKTGKEEHWSCVVAIWAWVGSFPQTKVKK